MGTSKNKMSKNVQKIISYSWRDCYSWDLLTPVTFYRYYRRIATFKGPLLLKLFTA